MARPEFGIAVLGFGISPAFVNALGLNRIDRLLAEFLEPRQPGEELFLQLWHPVGETMVVRINQHEPLRILGDTVESSVVGFLHVLIPR